jgi:hypothetical protein
MAMNRRLSKKQNWFKEIVLTGWILANWLNTLPGGCSTTLKSVGACYFEIATDSCSTFGDRKTAGLRRTLKTVFDNCVRESNSLTAVNKNAVNQVFFLVVGIPVDVIVADHDVSTIFEPEMLSEQSGSSLQKFAQRNCKNPSKNNQNLASDEHTCLDIPTEPNAESRLLYEHKVFIASAQHGSTKRLNDYDD